jgi:hypothetical protein
MSRGLERWQFTRIANAGFGDPLNAYAHSMGWFKERLYVGTTRANFCLLKGRTPLPVNCWPVPCPEEIYDLDLRAQIWCWEPARDLWQRVHVSPTVHDSEKDRQIPREIGYRAMTVFQGSSDPKPVLYVAAWPPARAGNTSTLLRSLDGETFVPVRVHTPESETEAVSSFRSLIPFEGRLFLSPVSRAGSSNISDIPVIMESSDPAGGVWRNAGPPAFGDATNRTVFEMAVFADHLYAGTMNPTSGFQVWKTRAEGSPPYRWRQVITAGAHRGPLNQSALSMAVFDGALYVGTGIQNGGHDRANDVGPASPELIRIHPDDSWDLLVGEARRTPDGPKRPLSGFGPGFDSTGVGYFWRMAVLDGFLYLSTLNWSVMLPYLRSAEAAGADDRWARWFGVDNLASFDGGFDLWCSPDGISWIPVTTDGFGNPYNYGARTLLSTPRGLFLGTANPFGPEVAARAPDGWTYAPNRRGGAEVWLGATTPDGPQCRGIVRAVGDHPEGEEVRL